MRAKGCRLAHRVDRREQVFDTFGDRVAPNEVHCAEFGVFQSATTRH